MASVQQLGPGPVSLTGISGVGWYVPRYRLQFADWTNVWRSAAAEGVREVAVPDVDEDVVTMSVAAANRAVDASGGKIDEVYLATASSPYIVKSSAAVVAAALFDHDVRAVDFGGSARALSSALLAARDAVASGRARRVLVIGADFIPSRPGDMAESRFGAAAGALVIDSDAKIARFQSAVAAHSTVTSYWQSADRPYVRRFDDARLERVVEHVGGIAPTLDLIAEESDVLAMQLSRRAAKEVTRNFKVRAIVGGDLYEQLGDCGNGGSVLALIDALAQSDAGDGICLIVQGSGSGAETVRFVRTAGLGAGRVEPAGSMQVSYIDYLKLSRRLTNEMPGEVGSSFPASAAWVRTEDMLVRPVGQICRACGSLNYPRRAICIDCRSRDLDAAPLPVTGSVLTYNIQHVMAVGPEQSPSPICVAQMDGVPAQGYGGKVSAMVLQQDAERLSIGAPVRLVFRRSGEELGLVKYGFKFEVISA